MKEALSIPGHVLKKLRRTVPCAENGITSRCIRQGKWCNANLYRIEFCGKQYVIKEFYSRHPLVRLTIGRLLIARERKVLIRLDGLPGLPAGVQNLGPYTLLMDYISGRSLSQIYRDRAQLPRKFFEELEHRIRLMHTRDYAHLDTRNLGNIICGDDGEPYIIDFQSSVYTRYLPSRIRRQMEHTDLSTVHKGWEKLCDEPLDAQRSSFKNRFERTRKFWVFRGYWIRKTFSKANAGKPLKGEPG